MGSGNIATLVADQLKGTARKPTFEDSTPNTATVVFVGASGEKILIDAGRRRNMQGIGNIDTVRNDRQRQLDPVGGFDEHSGQTASAQTARAREPWASSSLTRKRTSTIVSTAITRVARRYRLPCLRRISLRMPASNSDNDLALPR
jgi:hypothetical protein